MDVNSLRIAATVASFACFVIICAWAWARANRAAFEQAAQIPFQQD
jgi:cytochrome c oxidase cbb3-type subunit 4